MIQDRSNVTLLPNLDQGYTYLCGLYSAALPFLSAGYQLNLYSCYQKVRGYPLVLPGDPCTFDDVKGYVNTFADQANVFLQWFQGSGDVGDDLPTVDQLVRDNWFVIAGAAEWDIKAGQNYYHFFNLNGFDGTNIKIDDTFKTEDGVATEVPVTAFHQALLDNFDPNRDAVAFKAVTKN